jgi:hypothetical protein
MPGTLLRVVPELAKYLGAHDLGSTLAGDDHTVIAARMLTDLDDRFALASLPVTEDSVDARWHAGLRLLGRRLGSVSRRLEPAKKQAPCKQC